MGTDEKVSKAEQLFGRLDRYDQMLMCDFIMYLLDEIDEGTLLTRKDEFRKMLSRVKEPSARHEQLEILNNKLQKLENKNG